LLAVSTFSVPDLPCIAVWDTPELSRVVPIHAERRCDVFPEVDFWVRHVQQAEEDADRLSRGLVPVGEKYRPKDYQSAFRLHIRDLRAWASGTYVGSLSWCADQLTGAAGFNLEPDRVRARILTLLDKAERRNNLRASKAVIFVRDAA
jgi:hypothetical protein